MDDPDPMLAWALTRHMARLLGINLVEGVADGWLRHSEVAGMVDVCDSCGLSEHCRAWIAVTPRAQSLPAYCANKSALEALAI